ncbi:MAG: PepSY domain-containing protein [Ichthyobacteriaceae bacterium]|nr:PepSY domain-containing protein [Ichthyobacteriaceae bacterium]
MKKKSTSKKYHKLIGIIISLFILLFTVSGIVLNHRVMFSGVDVERSSLPSDYHYTNWNNASIKTSLKLSEDSILIYGNAGIYLTNKKLSTYKDFNNGFKQGVDNLKIEKVYRTKSGDLLCSTIFNLYKYNNVINKWQLITLPTHNQRIVDIIEDNKGLLLMSRSEILRTNDLINFEVSTLPSPINYNNKIGLFKTLWIIHSGEILGDAGRLLVDFMGLIFAFLAITGVLYFILPKSIKRGKQKNKPVKKRLKTLKFSLNWHKQLGWTFGILLFITTLTGMFLRPPLLISIANAEVGKIPFSELDTPNAWFDKLRRVVYDQQNNLHFVATVKGIYYSDDNFKSELKPLPINVPVSVMGITVFEFIDYGKLLVGSFNGLFMVDLAENNFIDYTTGKVFVPSARSGSPLGKNVVSGYSNHFDSGEVYFDYFDGATSIRNRNTFIEMPEVIQKTKMSLWNVMLEIHTIRFFKFMLGSFYILFVPLIGFATLYVLISGLIVVWRRKKKKKSAIKSNLSILTKVNE